MQSTLSFCAIVALISIATPVKAQSTVPLSGQVVSDATGKPVSGARVTVEGTTFSETTDTNGVFKFAGVQAGKHTIVVTGEGFETVRSEVQVADGANRALEVRLPARLSLREEVTVTGRTVGELGLTATSTTAGRLNLKIIDIPASVDTLDSAVMDARGYQKVSDAVSRMTGVVAGEHPTAPSSFSMRGFTANQVTTLRDGIWLGPSTMVMRPQNTFNLERVELLRGPSSVINGQGAVAGAINAITKAAQPVAQTSAQGLLSYGRFNTYHAALGVAGPVGKSLWYRVDVSRSGSDGFVARSDSGSSNITGSLLWRPVANLDVKVSADYLDDDLAKYFGTPLVPVSAAVEPLDIIRTTTGETLDARTRFVNYNVSDAYARSHQLLLRSDLTWRIGDKATVENVLYRFNAERRWKNAEGYVYCTSVVDVCTSVGQIQRYYGYFLLDHNQDLAGDRLTLNLNSTVAGRENRGVIGVEASNLDFERTRGFRRRVPLAPGDGVDLLNPTAGVYGQEELRGISPTSIDSWAVFAEDSLSVTNRLRVSGGLRYDGLDLTRRNLSPTRVEESGGFARDYKWWSWRAGAVFKIRESVAVYGQYSDAKDPVSSNIFLVNASQNFDLTRATQWEAGLKAEVNQGRTQFTLAYFEIERDDVLERFALDSATNIGGISSKGVEVAGTFRIGERSRVGVNLGYTDASFRPSANFVRLAGNQSPNVPRTTANLWFSHRELAGTPLEVGGSVRHVGDRFANNANTITMKKYTVADAYLAWTHKRLRATAKIDNLTDTVYASWADVFYIGQTDPSFLYANEMMIGAPRAFSVMLQIAF